MYPQPLFNMHISLKVIKQKSELTIVLSTEMTSLHKRYERMNMLCIELESVLSEGTLNFTNSVLESQ